MKRFGFLIAMLLVSAAGFGDSSFSQARVVGNYIYVSAQMPIDPQTGRLVDGSIEALTNVVIDNIAEVLHSKGFKLNQVVKTEVQLADIRDFLAMESAYAKRFNFKYPPARDVSQAGALPFDARIQISCIARK